MNITVATTTRTIPVIKAMVASTPDIRLFFWRCSQSPWDDYMDRCVSFVKWVSEYWCCINEDSICCSKCTGSKRVLIWVKKWTKGISKNVYMWTKISSYYGIRHNSTHHYSQHNSWDGADQCNRGANSTENCNDSAVNQSPAGVHMMVFVPCVDVDIVRPPWLSCSNLVNMCNVGTRLIWHKKRDVRTHGGSSFRDGTILWWRLGRFF